MNEKNSVNYKKPTFWIILISILLCISAAVFFLTAPANEENSSQSSTAPDTSSPGAYGTFPITYGTFPITYDYSHAKDYTSVADTGESVSFVQWDWSGMGFSSKNVTGGIASLITQELSNMKDSDKLSSEISSLEFETYGNSPAERGTLWFEWNSKLYRINPDRDEICRVDRHYGQGIVLNADEDFFELINDAWYYSGFDYYHGKIVDGAVVISHKYREYCDVDMTVTALTLSEDGNDSVSLRLTAKKDMEVSVYIDSQYSEDNLLDNVKKSFSLKANEPQEVSIEFRGDSGGSSFYITLTCGETRISLTA